VLNSAEKELTFINQIQVKIGAAVADSVFFPPRNFAKVRKIKLIFRRRFLEILKKNRQKKGVFELVLPDLEALLLWVAK
jgi:hypothetical protein